MQGFFHGEAVFRVSKKIEFLPTTHVGTRGGNDFRRMMTICPSVGRGRVHPIQVLSDQI